MIEKIKKYKDACKLICGLLASFVAGIWFVFSTYQSVLDKNNELVAALKTTQQMALKSVIWNNEIPVAERASACDVYLNAGYNSLTKQECKVILEKGAEEGIFSYVEGKVITNEHSTNISNNSSSYSTVNLLAY